MKTFKEKSSDGETEYSVTQDDSGLKCDCLGFQHRGSCKHVKKHENKEFGLFQELSKVGKK